MSRRPGDEAGGGDVDDATVDEHTGVDDDRLAVERRRASLVDVHRTADPAEDDPERVAPAAAGAHTDVDEDGRQPERQQHAERRTGAD